MERSLWLEMTAHCNLRCTFCYNPWRPDPPQSYGRALDVDDWRTIIDRLLPIGFDSVVLSGGEPMMFRGLTDVVRHLVAQDLTVVMTTNGTLATRARLEELRQAGLDSLQIPLHSMKPAVHDELSARACTDATIAAIMYGLELGFAVGIVAVATELNRRDLVDVARFAGVVGCSSMLINDLQPVSMAADNLLTLETAAEDFDECIRAVRAGAPDTLDLRAVHYAGRGRREIRSDMPWNRVAVSPEGEVKLCNMSERSVGPVLTMSDAELDALALDLNQHPSHRRDQVDNCACMSALAVCDS